MLRARLIAGVPADLVGSLTGLTEGRFPVAARARYADDLKEQKVKKAKAGQNAANVVESKDDRRSVEIYAKEGAPVVSTNDGQVKKIGRSRKLGRYVIVQDVYGNRYTYAGLGSVAKTYAAPREDVAERGVSAKALKANRTPRTPPPPAPPPPAASPKPAKRSPPGASAGPPPAVQAAVKERLFAHPSMPAARDNGGSDQLLEMQSKGVSTYDGYARPVKLDSKRFKLRRLRSAPGSWPAPRWAPSAARRAKGAHLRFAIRPAGKGAPSIDPKPILDGWKLLEATSIYRASGRNALRDSETGSRSARSS